MKNLKLDTFSLKVIALILMVIDHIGCYLIPSNSEVYMVVRMIGRLAAPLFMYCFAVGYKHTKNKNRYIIRLAIASVIVGVLNSLIKLLNVQDIDYTVFEPNMFFTFLASACLISSIERIFNDKSFVFCLPAIAISLIIIKYAEYSWFALFTIPCFYFTKNETLRNVLFIVGNMIICILTQNFVQIFMILSILLIIYTSKEKPKHKMKYFFYIFYPLHTAILVLIKMLWF